MGIGAELFGQWIYEQAVCFPDNGLLTALGCGRITGQRVARSSQD